MITGVSIIRLANAGQRILIDWLMGWLYGWATDWFTNGPSNPLIDCADITNPTFSIEYLIFFGIVDYTFYLHYRPAFPGRQGGADSRSVLRQVWLRPRQGWEQPHSDTLIRARGGEYHHPSVGHDAGRSTGFRHGQAQRDRCWHLKHKFVACYFLFLFIFFFFWHSFILLYWYFTSWVLQTVIFHLSSCCANNFFVFRLLH